MSPIALPPDARTTHASRRPTWWFGAALAVLCGWLWLAGSTPAVAGSAVTDAPPADTGTLRAGTASPVVMAGTVADLPSNLDPLLQRLPVHPDAKASAGVTAEPDVLAQAARCRRHTPAGSAAPADGKTLNLRAGQRAYRGRAPPRLA